MERLPRKGWPLPLSATGRSTRPAARLTGGRDPRLLPFPRESGSRLVGVALGSLRVTPPFLVTGFNSRTFRLMGSASRQQ